MIHNYRRAVIIFAALAAAFIAGYRVVEMGGIVLGWYTLLVFLTGAILLGLITWEKKTEGTQAIFVITVTFLLAFFVTVSYTSMDESSRAEFIRSAWAAALLLAGVVSSILLAADYPSKKQSAAEDKNTDVPEAPIKTTTQSPTSL